MEFLDQNPELVYFVNVFLNISKVGVSCLSVFYTVFKISSFSEFFLVVFFSALFLLAFWGSSEILDFFSIWVQYFLVFFIWAYFRIFQIFVFFLSMILLFFLPASNPCESPRVKLKVSVSNKGAKVTASTCAYFNRKVSVKLKMCPNKKHQKILDPDRKKI